MTRIHLLADHLISQIAAGEVVERPASVVKELVENALDAGATEVQVDLEVGGKRLVRVSDDGSGMGKDDALLAFDRHATSKIADFDDLQRVATLGFRGEALASIAAVAKVELTTAEEPGAGWRVRIEGGRVRGVEPAARARGSSLEVASLFWNVPARRKFLKATATEMRHAVNVVQGYCLARPDVAFQVRHEGRAVLDAAATGGDAEGLRERIRQLFGRDLADALVELPHGSRSGEHIGGFVGNRSTSRGRRLFVFVNGRLLRDRQVLATFYRTVREEWKHDEFPSLFLFLSVPPEELDVNVHPQKAEVRFRDNGVFDRLRASLRRGLLVARGEGDAPLRQALGMAEQPLAWEGLGHRRLGVAPQEEVGEGPPTGTPSAAVPGGPSFLSSTGADFTSPSKIAEPYFAPSTTSQVPLSGRQRMPRSLRLIGQYKGALVLLEGPDGLLLIDQHAAHERVLYERLERSLAVAEPAVQRLLVPRLLELAPAERMRLSELVPDLEPLGFVVEVLSGNDLALSGVPAVLGDDEAVALLVGLAGEEEARPADTDELRRRILTAVAASGACKAAIKIHRPLPPAQMEELVSDLFACEDPYACPHGRPTILKMSDADLERRFGRR